MRLVLLFVALVGLVGLSVARPSVLTVSVGQSIDTELGYSTIPIIVRWTSIFSEGEELDGTETGIDSKEIEELILSALGRKPGFEPETETESEPEAEPEPGSPEAAASLESKETDDLLDLDPKINSSTEPEPEAKPEPEPEAKPEPEPEVEEEDESERFLKEIRGILGIDSELKPITEPEPEAKPESEPEPEPEPEPEAEEEEDESERFFKEIRDILGIASGLNPSPKPEQRADPEPNLYSGPGERFYYKTVGGSNNGNGFVFPDLSDYEEPMDFSNFNADLNFSDRDFFLL